MQTETLDLMLEHRSIRTFTDERIPEDTLHLLIKAAQAAATSSFQQCVSLVHVSDNTLREALVPLTHNQTYVATAPTFLCFAPTMLGICRLCLMARSVIPSNS